jgi:Zn-dependent protease with chaperone function
MCHRDGAVMLIIFVSLPVAIVVIFVQFLSICHFGYDSQKQRHLERNYNIATISIACLFACLLAIHSLLCSNIST